MDKHHENLPALDNVKFLHVDEKDCIAGGFKNSSIATIPKAVVSWDKALFYFSMQEQYEYVWFYEYDVYFSDLHVFEKVDKEYLTFDLLIPKYFALNRKPLLDHWRIKKAYSQIASKERKHKVFDWPHWHHIDENEFSYPWYKSMICVNRMSRNLLREIKTYAERKGKIFFVECFIPTIAFANNLSVTTPKEMTKIYWKYFDEIEQLNKGEFIHPIKDINQHTVL